jgi:hypothetical protein
MTTMISIDTYHVHLACDDEVKIFKNEKQRNMWMKLHNKKCRMCAASVKRHGSIFVEHTESLNGTTSSSLQFDRDREHLRHENELRLLGLR